MVLSGILYLRIILATDGRLFIAETTKSINGRLSNLRDLIKKHGFEIYVDEEHGDFTFIESRVATDLVLKYYTKVQKLI